MLHIHGVYLIKTLGTILDDDDTFWNTVKHHISYHDPITCDSVDYNTEPKALNVTFSKIRCTVFQELHWYHDVDDWSRGEPNYLDESRGM